RTPQRQREHPLAILASKDVRKKRGRDPCDQGSHPLFPINEYAKYYEAPTHMKANGGIFMIDDFGRQQMRPMDLLNRWIVPLEKKYDYLTMATGTKIEVPFDQILIFSTNLDPQQLADEAFLRRIKFKTE